MSYTNIQLTEKEQRNFDKGTQWAKDNATEVTPEGYYWVEARDKDTGDRHYTEKNRGVGDIKGVVIHDTEGWTGGARTFQRRRASAHYGIERSGLITQMVPEKDVAWHAGKWSVNDYTIGIEHAGFADDSVVGRFLGYGENQLNESAKLVASILKRYGLPPTREYVFSHGEVGGCKGSQHAKPGQPRFEQTHGGSSCHYDPGPYWDWDDYMKRVRHYFYGGNVLLVGVIVGSAILAIGALTYRGLRG